jgi:hypothetical protein
LTPNLTLSGLLTANSIQLTQPGTGAIARSITQSYYDFPLLAQWGIINQSIAQLQSTGGGTLFVSGGVTATSLPPTYPNVSFDWLGPLVQSGVTSENPSTTWLSNRYLQSYFSGPHSGVVDSAFTVQNRAQGSGGLSPSLDVASTFSSLKQNAGQNPSIASGGELDGMYVFVRQDGPTNGTDNSDTSGILIDIGDYGLNGGVNMLEGQATVFSPGATTTYWSVHAQLGQVSASWLPTTNAQMIGLVLDSQAVARVGQNYGLLLRNNGANWDQPIRYESPVGVPQFSVDVSANVISQTHRFTASTPVVSTGQLGLGTTTTTSTATFCSVAGASGCLAINVSGTTRYLPFF